jgi:hypothetical protein
MRRTRTCAVLAILCLTCAPDLTSANGVEYFLSGSVVWTQEAVDANEERALSTYSRVSGQDIEAARSKLREVTVTIGCADDCQGVSRVGCIDLMDGSVYVQRAECPDATSIAHEFGHWWILELENRVDGHSEGLPYRSEPFKSLLAYECASPG